ncbi:type IV secretion system DNA-binding domain-containing protein [Paraburkholderia sp. UCT31]|uniref:type IV secretion system DNA-binding domain-containing protein n=1 Tax=Paraburkholderia sp. UCT31 TaxID=2615209 RepID=UPI00165679BD|nr:type IV secretion system DNA-binding domain-containing protein [Paraburkholderia sp. UCT31]MBC8741863.1 type IV secretion system DNA-binding domain-containing protein [Paraburkholderia sp. UCT31]
MSLDLIHAAGVGLAIYSLFLGWKKLASRWGTWFPVLKKVCEFGLYGVAIVLVGVTLKVLSQAEDIKQALFALAAGLALLPAIDIVLSARQKDEQFERGAKLGDAGKLKRQIQKSGSETSIKFGQVPLPRDAEPYHLLYCGATGSGKSVGITNLLDAIRARGDTALIVDSGGEFLTRYYNDETDAILNPFDDRCIDWSPTCELEGPWDAEALAKSIIPNGTGDSKEWNSYAQTFLTACLQRLAEMGKNSIKDLLYLVQAAPISELETVLAGTAASAQLASERTFGSIRTIASNYMSCYNYLSEGECTFSVGKFIRSQNKGFLFLTYRDDQLDSLRNLISCVLDVASRTILSLPADKDRRIWLIIDEFASIGRVQSIEAIATKARKMGGCLLIGLQSIAQLRERYGENTAQTILSCLSTWLVLRCIDTDTAEYMSKYLGEAEVTRKAEGQSNSDSGASKSWNSQKSLQRVVLPSELQSLPNLHGFLKLPGQYDLVKVALDFPEKRDKVAESYALRDFRARPMIKLKVPPKPQEAAPAPAPAAAPVAPLATTPAAPQVSRPQVQVQPQTPPPVRPPVKSVVLVAREPSRDTRREVDADDE